MRTDGAAAVETVAAEGGGYFALYLRASRLVRLGEYGKARDELEKAQALYPGNRKVMSLLAEVFYRLKLFRCSVDLYDRLVALNPAAPTLLTNRGLVHIKAGDYDSAERDFKKALELDPACLKTRKYLGLVYAKKAEYEKAIIEFSKSGAKKMVAEMESLIRSRKEGVASSQKEGAIPEEAEATRRLEADVDPLPEEEKTSEAIKILVERARRNTVGPAEGAEPVEVWALKQSASPKPAAGPDSHETLRDRIRREVREEEKLLMRAEIVDDLRREVGDALEREIRARLRAEIRAEVRTEVEKELRSAPAKAAPPLAAVPAEIAPDGDSPEISFLPDDEGGVTLSFAKRLYARINFADRVEGSFAAEREYKKFKGRRTNTLFGSDEMPLLGLTGKGTLHLSSRHGRFDILPKKREKVYLCEDLVFAIEPSLLWENGRLPIRKGFSLNLITFDGEGNIVLLLPYPMLSIPLTKEETPEVAVNLRDLVGWSGKIVPRIERLSSEEETTVIRLKGEGTVYHIGEEPGPEDDSAPYAPRKRPHEADYPWFLRSRME